MHRRRIVITGLGVLAPNGSGKDLFWQACVQGLSGVRSITRFDTSQLATKIGGEVMDFSPSASGLTPVECRLLDRSTQFSLAAANQAMEDAKLDTSLLSEEKRARIGVYLGTAMASAEKGQDLWLQLARYGSHPPRASLEQRELMSLMSSNVPSATVAAHHNLGGPNLTISTGCSSGADAIGQAFWLIQRGQADLMLAGGTDSSLNALSLSTFNVIHALSTRNDQPERASRPYDAQRDGFVLAEGSAVLLLEEREAALARGVHIYAEIVAFASNGNAYHMTALPEDGMPLQDLLRQIMAEAGLVPEQLGYINAHGSSTHLNDFAETVAYKGVFGAHAYQIPISSTKSLIGHTQGAASALETLVTALALDQQILPPTINLETPDPLCDLDYIPNVARPVDEQRPLRFALTHSSGFGGVNTALMLARHSVATEDSSFVTESEPIQPAMSPTHRSASRRESTTLSLPAPRRVVITGMGMVAPAGIGKAAFWSAVREGQSAIKPLPSPDGEKQALYFAGQVSDFRAEDYIERKLARRTDRMTHFALAAVQEALQDAGLVLERENTRRIGAVIANTLGGVEYVTQQIEQFHKRGPRAVSAFTAIAWLHVANVGQVSVLHGLQGYSKTPVNDLAGGLNALGMAYHAIQQGAADVLIAGGSEAPLHPYALQVLDASLPFSPTADPNAYRPFDQRANGLLLAEGAGICILEEYEHAQKRGAPIYGELVGYAQTCSPGALTVPDTTAYVRALQLLLLESQMSPEDIACVYLDGRALPAWDASETRALRDVFGAAFETLTCSVPRTQFGHSLAAAGALDTICALLALEEKRLLPTLNSAGPDSRFSPPGLVTGKARAQQGDASGALIVGRAFGGSHVALALRKIEAEKVTRSAQHDR